jgi:flagellar P-ring protein precursor FlgI
MTRVAGSSIGIGLRSVAALVLLTIWIWPTPATAQDTRIRELTHAEREVPVRLVGYGLVVGLDGTGDRAMGRYGATHTVRSVVNLLRNFAVEVPEEMLRTRNVAAVLVTAEISPYLRAGGRFQVSVASVGDATSLRGGVLWTAPLVAEAGGQPVATAQGALMLSEGAVGNVRGYGAVETSARLPEGGILALDLPRPDFARASRLLLREPNLGTATRIAAAINAEFGERTAIVEDPGSVALQPPGDTERPLFLAAIGDLRIQPDRFPRIVIDGRDGTVVAGGDLTVREAVVSHGAMTLTIGGAAPGGGPGNGAGAGPALAAAPAPGAVRVAPGTSVQDVAAALHAEAAPPSAIATIFESLRSIGALNAEVVIR